MVFPVFAVSNQGAIFYGSMTAAQQTSFGWTGGGNSGNGPAVAYGNGGSGGLPAGFEITGIPFGQQACLLQADAWVSQTVSFSAPGVYPLSGT